MASAPTVGLRWAEIDKGWACFSSRVLVTFTHSAYLDGGNIRLPSPEWLSFILEVGA